MRLELLFCFCFVCFCSTRMFGVFLVFFFFCVCVCGFFLFSSPSSLFCPGDDPKGIIPKRL